MDQWPPTILFAASRDVTRQAVRDMLRASGVRDLEFCSSAEKVFSAIEKQDQMWEILILDNTLPNALELMEKIREELDAHMKLILIFSGPTRQEIMDAIQSGVSEILTYPFSQATIEKKLHKLTGTMEAVSGKWLEMRRLPRFDLPVVLVAPSLSDSPLIAEDVNEAGFKIVVSKKPELETFHDVSIQFSERKFEHCKAVVAWVQENETQPGTWPIGVLIQMPDTEREQFSAALREALAEKNGGS